MFNKAAEKTSSYLLLIGAPLTTVFLVTKSVTDPVNATKLALAGGLGFGLLALTLIFRSRELIKEHKLFLLVAAAFVFSALNAVLQSDSPVSQNIYGTFGRNTGFLTYGVLMAVSISTLVFKDKSTFNRIIVGLFIAGVINVVYCAWVLMFGDFLSWSNPYGNILGLFGNPNFISAFLGMFITCVFAYLCAPGTRLMVRLGGALLIVTAFYEVVASNAIQGIVVTSGGIAIVVFFILRNKFESSSVLYAYSGFVLTIGTLSILGALQKGPFNFIYKNSVSLRGAYWDAGITMGMQNPLTGVGMDSYGDWYRRARSENAATVLPGPNTITNAAHNVVIDFFAYGGFPLLISYVAMLLLAALASVKVIRRSKNYEPVFVATFAAWACYQVQSLISINQIGLALWGWILTGALIAFERASRSQTPSTENQLRKVSKPRAVQSPSIISPQLIAGLGIVVGLLIATPPFSSDSRWRSSLDSKNADLVEKSLVTSYLNPLNSTRFAQAVQLYANSQMMDEALATALKGVEYNPDYFDAWKLLYYLPNSSEAQKLQALENLKRLDPLNPNVTGE